MDERLHSNSLSELSWDESEDSFLACEMTLSLNVTIASHFISLSLSSGTPQTEMEYHEILRSCVLGIVSFIFIQIDWFLLWIRLTGFKLSSIEISGLILSIETFFDFLSGSLKIKIRRYLVGTLHSLIILISLMNSELNLFSISHVFSLSLRHFALVGAVIKRTITVFSHFWKHFYGLIQRIDFLCSRRLAFGGHDRQFGSSFILTKVMLALPA